MVNSAAVLSKEQLLQGNETNAKGSKKWRSSPRSLNAYPKKKKDKKRKSTNYRDDSSDTTSSVIFSHVPCTNRVRIMNKVIGIPFDWL